MTLYRCITHLPNSRGLIFVDEHSSCIFFSTKKIKQLQNENHSIGLTLMYKLKKVVAAYYNIIITYER